MIESLKPYRELIALILLAFIIDKIHRWFKKIKLERERRQEALYWDRVNLRKMGYNGLIKHLIEKGWSEGSAHTLARSIWEVTGLDQKLEKDRERWMRRNS